MGKALLWNCQGYQRKANFAQQPLTCELDWRRAVFLYEGRIDRYGKIDCQLANCLNQPTAVSALDLNDYFSKKHTQRTS